MVRHPSLYAVLLGLLTLAAGCTAPQKPTATFRGMEVADVTPRGFTMNVDLDVQNPNAFALPLERAEYTLSLAGATLVEQGKVEPRGRIPAQGTETVRLPIPVSFDRLLAVGPEIRKSGGKLPYGIDAELHFDSKIPVVGVQRVPIHYQGRLDVRELLSRNWGTILNSPAAKELAQQVLGGMFRF